MTPNFGSNYDDSAKKQRDEWELTQKRKIKKQVIKMSLRQLYANCVQTLIQHPKYEDKSFGFICEQAYDLAKEIEMKWLMENPEDGADNVDDVQLHTHLGGGF